MKRYNAERRLLLEAAANIRFSVKIQGEKRERAKSEARAKVEANIWENTDKTRKSR